MLSVCICFCSLSIYLFVGCKRFKKESSTFKELQKKSLEIHGIRMDSLQRIFFRALAICGWPSILLQTYDYEWRKLYIRSPNHEKKEICTEKMKAIRFSEMIHFSFRAVNVSGTSVSIHLDVRYTIIYFKPVIREY